MMNITVCVMLPERDSDFSQEMNGKHRVLSIIAVYETPQKKEAVTSPRTGLIHVTGMPTPKAWGALSKQEVLTRLNSTMCSERIVNGKSVERKMWVGNPGYIKAAKAEALLLDRQVDMTWEEFSAMMQNRGSRLTMRTFEDR